MAENNDKTEGGIKTPLGELSFKGKKTAEFITILSLLVLAVLSTLYWNHDKNTEKSSLGTNQALTKISDAVERSTKAQRLMTCIISLPQERREQEFTQSNSFCQRMANLP